jgi:hypothetical protein
VTRGPLAAATDQLARTGLLLLHDATRPSLTTIVAGAPVKGSWWGHSHGGEIFATATALEDHADVLVAKLLDAKVTFVHRRLWPALIGVGMARSPWQCERLDAAGRALLARVEDEGRVRLSAKRDAAAKLLEERLLVLGEQVHTESGRHETELVSWREVGKRARLRGKPPTAARAQATLEAAAVIAAPGARLPWQR